MFPLHHSTLSRMKNMIFLDLWLLLRLTLLGELVSSQSITDVARNKVRLRKRDGCGKDPSWQPTKDAWKKLEADKNMASWWGDVSTKPHHSFANELGRGFGSHLNAFECSIGAVSTCIAPGCSGKLRKKDQAKICVEALDDFH